MAHPHSDPDLVARAKTGDRFAFDELVTAYEERVRMFVASRARLRIGARLDVDEVLQETFTRAYESIGRFKWSSEDSFFKWLCGIAKHVLMKTAERHRKIESLDGAAALPTRDVSPSKALRRGERLERLQRSLDGLPSDYRQVIQLCRLEGLKIKDVAERLGRSTDSVKHLLSRALEKLKTGFGDTESLHLPDEGLQLDDDHG